MSKIYRFAPSPTGHLHVGGARTALFNWLLARGSGARYLLRIEDTDRQRSTEASVQQILNSLAWLGINWDDEPFFQSQNHDRHVQVAFELLSAGKAYRCFCSAEDLAPKRKRAELAKESTAYDQTCRHLSPRQIEQNLNANQPFTIRLAVPGGETVFEDGVRGTVRVANTEIDDYVILRSDGTPVYQLAVVVDDHDMGITDVLRGADHISNTPKQILLYQAMNWEVPRFIHVPLILGTDKKRLSKRHGATSVEEFRERGILPDALFNFLCLIGWSPGDDREIFNREELASQFDVARINKASGVFDEQKLLWMNARYIQESPTDEIVTAVSAGLNDVQRRSALAHPDEFKLLISLLQPRAQTVPEIISAASFFFDDPAEYEEKGVTKYFHAEDVRMQLQGLAESLAAITDFNAEPLEVAVRQYAESIAMSAGKVIHPLRLALTGSTRSPGIFEVMEILGKEAVLTRIERAVSFIQRLNVTDGVG
jgi:glutamyl-tRNA synthetase